MRSRPIGTSSCVKATLLERNHPIVVGVPTFDYGGISWNTIGIASNGHIVVGGGDGLDVTPANTDFPDTARPNNVLAPFWTDLNPDLGGTVWIELLTDGFDSWTVVEWEAVPNASNPAQKNTAQVWIGWNTDTNPAEDISFTYAAVTGGNGGKLTVGAENDLGSSGDRTYFNGSGTSPAPSFGDGSTACDTVWPAPPFRRANSLSKAGTNTRSAPSGICSVTSGWSSAEVWRN